MVDEGYLHCPLQKRPSVLAEHPAEQTRAASTTMTTTSKFHSRNRISFHFPPARIAVNGSAVGQIPAQAWIGGVRGERRSSLS